MKTVRYDDWHVLKIDVSSERSATFLRKLMQTPMGESFLIFDHLVTINQPFVIGVPPNIFMELRKRLQTQGIQFLVMQHNLQELIDGEAKTNMNVFRRSGKTFDWKRYYNLEEIDTWLKSLPSKYEHVTLIKGGRSYEGRDINGVLLAKNPNNPGIYIEGGLHAREWISPATVTFMLNQLLTSDNEKVQNLANNYNWYILPVTNPDGYNYTFTVNRMWRKNRSMQNHNCGRFHGANGPGVDLNRNWDCFWEQEPNHVCSELYPGTHAFSEVETRTLSEFMKGIKHKLQVYLTFHSFSQVLLLPYSAIPDPPHNLADLMYIANATVEGLKKRYGTHYKYGTVHEIMYKATGSTSDYVYRKLGIDIPIAYELRPSWEDPTAFLLPVDQIIPTGLETLDSVVELIAAAKRIGYFDKKTVSCDKED